MAVAAAARVAVPASAFLKPIRISLPFGVLEFVGGASAAVARPLAEAPGDVRREPFHRRDQVRQARCSPRYWTPESSEPLVEVSPQFATLRKPKALAVVWAAEPQTTAV